MSPVALMPSHHGVDHENVFSVLDRLERRVRWSMSSRKMLSERLDSLLITDSQREDIQSILDGIASGEEEIFLLLDEVEMLCIQKFR
jgi:hypothetical protein